MILMSCRRRENEVMAVVWSVEERQCLTCQVKECYEGRSSKIS